jgi:hypothetical protein
METRRAKTKGFSLAVETVNIECVKTTAVRQLKPYLCNIVESTVLPQ